MKNSQSKFVVPHQRYAPINTVEFIKQVGIRQNNLNNSVGGSTKNITVPEFYSPIPGTPNAGTHASKMGNITNSLCISQSKYDPLAFEGGKKSRKQKSRKQKSRKQKSRKVKSRKQKSRKPKSRKQKSRKPKSKKY